MVANANCNFWKVRGRLHSIYLNAEVHQNCGIVIQQNLVGVTTGLPINQIEQQCFHLDSDGVVHLTDFLEWFDNGVKHFLFQVYFVQAPNLDILGKLSLFSHNIIVSFPLMFIYFNHTLLKSCISDISPWNLWKFIWMYFCTSAGKLSYTIPTCFRLFPYITGINCCSWEKNVAEGLLMFLCKIFDNCGDGGSWDRTDIRAGLGTRTWPVLSCYRSL